MRARNIHAFRACVFVRRNKVYDVSGIGESGKLRRTEILGLAAERLGTCSNFVSGVKPRRYSMLLECYAESTDRCRVFLADIAKMPRFICNMRYVLLFRRIAKDETVIPHNAPSAIQTAGDSEASRVRRR